MYRLAILTILGTLTCGCGNTQRCVEVDTGSHAYSRRAYREMEERRREESCPRLDEVVQGPELLDLSECEWSDEWSRRPYESIEGWLERIRCRLCADHTHIQELETAHHELLAAIKDRGRDLQGLISSNQQLRAMVQKLVEHQGTTREFKAVALKPKIPFTVHVVRPGDTLYSIALHYYDDPEMVTQIVLWNQNWIRHRDEINSGLALLLFEDRSITEVDQAVGRYLTDLRERSNEA